MIHLGDITKISGYDVPIVDCVIGGSPCQDLSVAGKRAGLDGERSGLFMEQIRITKEMREKDGCNGRTGEFIRPRFGVWENVPGALSSNKGEDFKAVLEEFAKVVDKDAVIPMPPKGKWNTSGCILGDGWSIAWRILDAQFWGVPQRRRRITLVADFGGRCAPEILFERKGLSRHSSESREERKDSPTDAQGSSLADDREGEERRRGYVVDTSAYSINHQGGNVEQIIEEKAGTLTASMNSSGNNKLSVAYSVADLKAFEWHSQDLRVKEIKDDVSPTLSAGMGMGGANMTTPMLIAYSVENHPADSRVNIDESGKVQTLTSRMGTGGGNVPMVMECFRKSARARTSDDATTWVSADVANTLNTFDMGEARCSEVVVEGVGCDIYNLTETGDVAASLTTATGQGASNTGPSVIVMDKGEPVICLQGNQIDQADTSVCNGSGWKEGTSYTLNTRDRHSVVYGQKPRYIVRRLTPMECERLQGYPDLWTDIGEYTDSKGKVKKTSDSARYKALGNSIALPPWKWVIKRLCSHYERDATMASLFDGIGGFPYLWEQINGKGSCLWASEIEDFPIAVTQKRID